MSQRTKILLGGVPFGEDNIGDEAILECVIEIVRQVAPDSDIVVSTSDRQATEEKFGVRCVPLFGFGRPHTDEELQEAFQWADVYIWSGATGLSDYPENATSLLTRAQSSGAKTALWGVGMNDELNPAMYALPPRRTGALLRTLTRLTGDAFDALAYERFRRELRAKKAIRDALSQTDLIVLRDFPSRVQVQRAGVEKEVLVGADSAVILEPAPWETLSLSPDLEQTLNGSHKLVGVCISAQREVRRSEELVAFLDRIVANDETRVVFIPMNPITDRELMENLQSRMQHADRTVMVVGQREPANIVAIASKMDLVIASRLHLLILATNTHVPIIGIARGSKVDNFLAPFGLRPAGSTEECNFEELWTQSQRWLRAKSRFRDRSEDVREELLARLDVARGRLQELIASAPIK